MLPQPCIILHKSYDIRGSVFMLLYFTTRVSDRGAESTQSGQCESGDSSYRGCQRTPANYISAALQTDAQHNF